ncbi:MAG: FAD-dependent thymidylate synthase [Holosporales bacterium]|jgi:thymidylate synthase (FAD)|nr:FAD-dependent thymidylate synthase [Holosporales bacterium]
MADESTQIERTSVESFDSMLGQVIPVLDHGFIRVIDYMGDDTSIVQAARVSYGKGTKQSKQDAGLIDYLMRNDHTSPFEMCEIKLHIKMPLFVARQWLRHRTASVNEYSARYSVLNDDFYVPDTSRICAQSQSNKQTSGEALPLDVTKQIIDTIKSVSRLAHDKYKELIDIGLVREVARSIIPLNTYTEMYWKIDLHNLLRFVRLRNSPHAQYEIRVYAEKIQELLKAWVPLVYESFIKHKMHISDKLT